MMANKDKATISGVLSLITHCSSFIALCSLLLIQSVFVACEREERRLRVDPPSPSRGSGARLKEAQAGRGGASGRAGNEYEERAFDVAEGARLFQWYNCVGCHAQGGGGMGPPLMDEKWIYGSDPEQVFTTIVEGRPNGMPPFRDKVPDHQVWQLSAYVRSMSGQLSKDVSPGRKDSMSVKKPELRTEEMEPKQ